MSFGGNFSAMTGLSGVVDAAVVLGGPIDKTLGKDVMTNLPFGTADTMGNDVGFDHQPTKRCPRRQNAGHESPRRCEYRPIGRKTVDPSRVRPTPGRQAATLQVRSSRPEALVTN
jgi:hypothetical protein